MTSDEQGPSGSVALSAGSVSAVPMRAIFMRSKTRGAEGGRLSEAAAACEGSRELSEAGVTVDAREVLDWDARPLEFVGADVDGNEFEHGRDGAVRATSPDPDAALFEPRAAWGAEGLR